MKRNHNNRTENTYRKNNTSKFLRVICVAFVLSIIMTGMTCFSTNAATNAGSMKLTQAQAKTYSGTYLYCTADDFVSLRQSASVSSTELAKIPHGNKMTYLNSKSGKWYYVQYNSQKGYVYEDYVTFDGDSLNTKSYSSSSSDTTASILYCTANDFVSLRKSASVNSTELAKIYRGEKMGYLNKKSGKWYYVQYGTKKGYVYSDYVSSVNPNSSTGTKNNTDYSSKGNSGYSNNSYHYYDNYNYNYDNSKKYQSTCCRCGGSGTVVCTSCDGSGKMSHTHTSPSFGMGGSSYYSTYSKCYACSGKGVTKCLLCGGDGLV